MGCTAASYLPHRQQTCLELRLSHSAFVCWVATPRVGWTEHQTRQWCLLNLSYLQQEGKYFSKYSAFLKLYRGKKNNPLLTQFGKQALVGQQHIRVKCNSMSGSIQQLLYMLNISSIRATQLAFFSRWNLTEQPFYNFNTWINPQGWGRRSH